MQLRSFLQTMLVATLWLLIAQGVARAHGGMAGPDELGPPLGMSVAIGLVCYYVITLWPRRGENDRRDGVKNGRSRGR